MKKVLLMFLSLTCFTNLNAQNRYPIIPLPSHLAPQKGQFKLNAKVGIQDLTHNPITQIALKPLVEKCQLAAGISLKKAPNGASSNIIRIIFDKHIDNPEGYLLQVSPTKIEIKAKQPAGVFYAVQSILQLLPPSIEQKEKVVSTHWDIPCVKIEDSPRFGYRGIMLDVSRHYMPFDFLKKYIDELASLKINRFHWHLTDGQAFRFESKKYPLLHTAKSPQWPTNEGYYSQDEMRALVKYAQDRFITIIPEIDVPAHSNAALVAYPQYACQDSTGKQLLYQGEFCPKEESVAFVNDIIDEVISIFPSEYIHIGGDEASKQAWKKCPNCQKRIKERGLKSIEELQSDFVANLEKHINEKGRKMIGWDEILEGGLAPNATVMAWRSLESGVEAAKMKHNAIMSPTSHCYLDYYQSEDPNEPIAFAGFINLPRIYSFEPVPDGLTAEEESYILGPQANLWTEQVPVGSHAEYMTFPRGVALAEVGWSKKEARNYTNFLDRLGSYLTRMDYRQVNYAKHFFEIKTSTTRAADQSIQLALLCDNNNAPIYYTLDGSTPTVQSFRYESPIPIKQNTNIKVATVMKDRIVDEISRTITFNKATGLLMQLTTPPSKRYQRGGIAALTNGMFGGNGRFNDEEWLGWNNQDFEGVLTWPNQQSFSKISLRFFHKPSSWVWIPRLVAVWGSNDGQNFELIHEQNVTVPSQEGVLTLDLNVGQKSFKYLKFKANVYGTIPTNYTGAGDPAWLFVDEIVVE
jgi:hexosaminidase